MQILLENLAVVLRCLEGVATSMVVELQFRLSRISSVNMMVMFRTILTTTEGLHKYLQKESLDLAQGMSYKVAVLETLKSMQSNETVEKLYMETKGICEFNSIIEILTGHRRKQKRMADYAFESCLDIRVQCSTEGDLKHIFYPYLDRMINELINRFSGVGVELIKGHQCLQPISR